MANTTAVCNSFKTELLNGIHALGTSVIRAATTADSFKVAVYFATGTNDKTTTAYAVTNEVTANGNYVAGGQAFTWIAPSNVADVSFSTPSASFAWTGVTWSAFDSCLLYNTTQGNKAIAVFNFGSQSVTAGNFTLTMPANSSAAALLRLS